MANNPLVTLKINNGSNDRRPNRATQQGYYIPPHQRTGSIQPTDKGASNQQTNKPSQAPKPPKLNPTNPTKAPSPTLPPSPLSTSSSSEPPLGTIQASSSPTSTS